MMKNILAGAVFAAVAAGGAWAQDAVTLQLKWVTQAQFAGYYVAEAKGFYDEENLDVTILPGGPDIAPEQVIAGGGADVITTWMPAALAARERGVPLVNIAQPFKNQGLSFVCRKDQGVESTADFPGKTLGVWFFGNEYPFYAWMAKLGLATDGSDGGVTVLKQAFDVEALLNGSAACISVMTYNEYGQVLDAGITPEQLTFFSYGDQGVKVMEDGLYVLEFEPAGPGLQGQDGPLRARLDEGLEVRRGEPGGSRADRRGRGPDRSPDARAPDLHDGRGGEADGGVERGA